MQLSEGLRRSLKGTTSQHHRDVRDCTGYWIIFISYHVMKIMKARYYIFQIREIKMQYVNSFMLRFIKDIYKTS